MNSPRMMHRMTFRPLNDISQPGWRFNIGMLKYAEEICNQQYCSHRLRGKSHDIRKANRSQQRKRNHIKWTEIKSAIYVHAFGTVMHLVKNSPEPVTPVHAPMPYIHS